MEAVAVITLFSMDIPADALRPFPKQSLVRRGAHPKTHVCRGELGAEDLKNRNRIMSGTTDPKCYVFWNFLDISYNVGILASVRTPCASQVQMSICGCASDWVAKCSDLSSI